MTSIYSHSKIDMFLTCPKQYDFKYNQHTPAEYTSNVEIQSGTLFHLFAKNFAEQPVEENKEYAFKMAVENADFIVDSDVYNETKSLIDNWDYSEAFNGKILAVEKSFVIEINGIKYQGIIDIAIDENGVLKIRDYKTGRRFYTSDMINQSRQLIGYTLAARYLWPEYTHVVIEYNMVRFNKIVTKSVTDEDINEFVSFINNVNTLINNTKNWDKAAKPGSHCFYCAYKTLCVPFNEYINKENTSIDNLINEDYMRNYIDNTNKLKYYESLVEKQKKFIIDKLMSERKDSYEFDGFKLKIRNTTSMRYNTDILLQILPDQIKSRCLAPVKGEIDKIIDDLPKETANLLLSTATISSRTPTLIVTKVAE